MVAVTDRTAPQTFEDIESLYCGSVYPGQQFRKGAKTALCLFSAMWHGTQDVYWLARDGLTGTCVDREAGKLAEMKAVYPKGWEFVEADVWEFAENAADEGKQWDVVNLDPWTGDFDRCAELLPQWAALATKTVIMGFGGYRRHDPPAPEGFEFTLKSKRSTFKGGIYWMVYERA